MVVDARNTPRGIRGDDLQTSRLSTSSLPISIRARPGSTSKDNVRPKFSCDLLTPKHRHSFSFSFLHPFSIIRRIFLALRVERSSWIDDCLTTYKRLDSLSTDYYYRHDDEDLSTFSLADLCGLCHYSAASNRCSSLSSICGRIVLFDDDTSLGDPARQRICTGGASGHTWNTCLSRRGLWCGF